MMEQKEVLGQYTEMVNEVISILAEVEIETHAAAAKVAGARESKNERSEKIQMSKLDSVVDGFRDQILDMSFDLLKPYANDLVDDEFDANAVFSNLRIFCEDFVDWMMDWYKEILIVSNTLTLDTVLHPKKVSADKRELNNLKVQFKLGFYDFVQQAIARIIEMLGGEEAEIDSDSREVIDYVLEVCEDNMTDLKSQLTGKVKKNPLIRNMEEVRKIAEKTAEELEEIRKTEEEIENGDFKEVKEEEPVFPGEVSSVYGIKRESFLEISKYYNKNKDTQLFHA